MRETRYLWIGNLPDNVREERIAEHFRRYGKIDKVRFLTKRGGDNGLNAYVAFMDIRSAQKAKTAVNVIGERELITDYFDPVIRSGTEEGQRHAQQQQPPHNRGYRRYDGVRESSATERETARESQASFDRSYQNSEAGNSYDSDRSRSRVELGDSKPHSQSISKKRSDAKGVKKKRGEESKVKIKKAKQKKLKERGRSPTVKQRKSYNSSGSSPSGSGSKRKESSSGRSSTSGSASRSISDSRRTSSASSTSSTGTSSSSKTRCSNSNSSGSSYEVEEKPESRKLVAMCIRKLPVRPTITSLRDGIFHEFKKYGKVKSVLVRGDGADRHALVLFRTAAEASKAIAHARTKLLFGAAIEASIYEGEVSGQELEECGGIIDEFHPRASRTLFVGNLDKTVGYSDIQNIFVRFGEIVAIEIKKQHNIPQYAFLQYTDIMSVVKAITKMDGEKLGRNTLKLGFGKTVISSCLWVDGVTDSFTENYLASCFQRYGPVKHVVIDRSRGQALVFYAQYDFAQSAMQKMRARKLNGSRLKMDYASNELVEIFLKHMKSSGQSFQGLDNIRQLLQPPSSPTPMSSGNTSTYGRSSVSQESRSNYYEERHQSSNYNDEQYTDGNYRRNWRGRSRERHPYPVDQSSYTRPKRNYDEPSYSRTDYHRDSTWEHDNYPEGRNRSSQYDQDYRQRDYDFRREQRAYVRKQSRGNAPYDETFRFRGRDRYRDERDVEGSRERDQVGERYYSRAVHLSPSHPRYHPRRSRSLSPPRDSERYTVERDASFRRRDSCSPDDRYDSLPRMNSIDSKSSSHSDSRFAARSGDVDMREYMDDDKLSVSSPHSDERIVEFTEKAKKLCVRKRVTEDLSLQEDSLSPKLGSQYNYRVTGDKDDIQHKQPPREDYDEPAWPSESPAYSDHSRSRSGTPTRDENEDLIGEVIIKKSGSKSVEKTNAKEEIKSHYKGGNVEEQLCDKDYRKEFSRSSAAVKPGSEKPRPSRSSTASLIQRVHSPETGKKGSVGYEKDFDYRKHSTLRQSKSGSHDSLRHRRSKTSAVRSDEQSQAKYAPVESGNDYDDANSPTNRQSVSSGSNLLKREYSPKMDDDQPLKKMRSLERVGAEREIKKEPGRDDHRKRSEVKRESTEDRPAQGHKRKHPLDTDLSGIKVKRERKSISEHSKHKSHHDHHAQLQKHDARMSIASQMFLQDEEESGTESPALQKGMDIPVRITKDKLEIEQIVVEEEPEIQDPINLPLATVSAAKSLLPKSIPQTSRPKQTANETSQKVDGGKDGKTKKEGNLTELEKEKERLQQLLSKLDSEKQLDPKDAEEVADVVLQGLTEKARSKLNALKAPTQESGLTVENDLLTDDVTLVGNDIKTLGSPSEKDVETVTIDADDVTFEEEIVVDTIEEVTEDEFIETEIEEVTVKEEDEITVEEKPSEDVIEDTVITETEVPISSVSSEETSKIDHTQGYRKQMEARKKEMEKIERKMQSQRKKIFKKQEKEKKKQIKRVAAMRGPGQTVVSSLLDDEVDDDLSTKEGNDDVEVTENETVLEYEQDSAPSLEFETGSVQNDHNDDVKLDSEASQTGDCENATPLSLAGHSEDSLVTSSKDFDSEELWPPDRGKPNSEDVTPQNPVQEKTVFKDVNDTGPKILNHVKAVTGSNAVRNISPFTPSGGTGPNTPGSGMKESSPKIAVPGVTPASSLTSSHSHRSHIITPTTTQTNRTPHFTTPSPASTSSTSSSKSQRHKQMKLANSHQRPGHSSSRSGHHSRSDHNSRSHGSHGSSSDHRRPSLHSHHSRSHNSSSSSGHNSQKLEGYKKQGPQPSRRSLATITVGLDASPSKPTRPGKGVSELSSPCSDEEPVGRSPAQLLSPVSPLLKSPGNVMIPSRKSDSNLSSALQNSSSATSLTDRLKLLGKVKKKTTGLIPAVKVENAPAGFIPHERNEAIESRLLRSSIIDQDCERLSHVHRGLTDGCDGLSQKLTPFLPTAPLFAGSKFLKASACISGNAYRATATLEPLQSSTNTSSTSIIHTEVAVDGTGGYDQSLVSSIGGPKNVISLSSSDLPVTAERQHDAVGKKHNLDTDNSFNQSTPIVENVLPAREELSAIPVLIKEQTQMPVQNTNYYESNMDVVAGKLSSENAIVQEHINPEVETDKNAAQDPISHGSDSLINSASIVTEVKSTSKDVCNDENLASTGSCSPMDVTPNGNEIGPSNTNSSPSGNVEEVVSDMDISAGSCLEIPIEEHPVIDETRELQTVPNDDEALQSGGNQLSTTDTVPKPKELVDVKSDTCSTKVVQSTDLDGQNTSEDQSEIVNSAAKTSSKTPRGEVKPREPEAVQAKLDVVQTTEKKDKVKSVDKKKLAGKSEASKTKLPSKHKLSKDGKKDKSLKKDGSKKFKVEGQKLKPANSSSSSAKSKVETTGGASTPKSGSKTTVVGSKEQQQKSVESSDQDREIEKKSDNDEALRQKSTEPEIQKLKEKPVEAKARNEEVAAVKKSSLEKKSSSDKLDSKKAKSKSEKRDKIESVSSSSKEKSDQQKTSNLPEGKTEQRVKSSSHAIKSDFKQTEGALHSSKKKKKKKHASDKREKHEKKLAKINAESSNSESTTQTEASKKKSEVAPEKVKKTNLTSSEKAASEDDPNEENVKTTKRDDDNSKLAVRASTDKTTIATLKKEHKKDSTLSKTARKWKSHPELKTSHSVPSNLKKSGDNAETKKDISKKSHHKKAEKAFSTFSGSKRREHQPLIFSDSSSSDMEESSSQLGSSQDSKTINESRGLKKDEPKKTSDVLIEDEAKWSDLDDDSRQRKGHWRLSSSSSLSDSVPPPVTQSALLVTETLKNETILPKEYRGGGVFSDSSADEDFEGQKQRMVMSKSDDVSQLKSDKKKRKKTHTHEKLSSRPKKKPHDSRPNKHLFLTASDSDSSENRLVMSLSNSDISSDDQSGPSVSNVQKPKTMESNKSIAMTFDSDNDSVKSDHIVEYEKKRHKPQVKPTAPKPSSKSLVEKKSKVSKSDKVKSKGASDDNTTETEHKKIKQKSDKSSRKSEGKSTKKLSKMARKILDSSSDSEAGSQEQNPAISVPKPKPSHEATLTKHDSKREPSPITGKMPVSKLDAKLMKSSPKPSDRKEKLQSKSIQGKKTKDAKQQSSKSESEKSTSEKKTSSAEQKSVKEVKSDDANVSMKKKEKSSMKSTESTLLESGSEKDAKSVRKDPTGAELTKHHKKSQKSVKRHEKSSSKSDSVKGDSSRHEGNNVATATKEKDENIKKSHKKIDKVSKQDLKKHEKRSKTEQPASTPKVEPRKTADIREEAKEVKQETEKDYGVSLFGSDSDDDNDNNFKIDEGDSRLPSGSNFSDENLSAKRNNEDETDVASIALEQSDEKQLKSSKSTYKHPRNRSGSAESFLATSTTDESDEEQKKAIKSAISLLDQDYDVQPGKQEKESSKKDKEESAEPVLPQVTEKIVALSTEKTPTRPQSVSPSRKFTESREKRRRSYDSKESKHEAAPGSSVSPGYSLSKHSLSYGAKDRRERMDKMNFSISHEREQEAVRSIMGESSDADSYFSDVKNDDAPPPHQAADESTPDSDRSHHKSKDSDGGSGMAPMIHIETQNEDAKQEPDSSQENDDIVSQSEFAKPRSTAEENELAAAVNSIFDDFGNSQSTEENSFISDIDTPSRSDPCTESRDQAVQKETPDGGEKSGVKEEDSNEAVAAASTLLAKSQDDTSSYDFQSTENKSGFQTVDKASNQRNSAVVPDLELPSVRGDSVVPNVPASSTIARERKQSSDTGASQQYVSRENKSLWTTDDKIPANAQTLLLKGDGTADKNTARQQVNTPSVTPAKSEPSRSVDYALSSNKDSNLSKPTSAMPFITPTQAAEAQGRQSPSSNMPFVAVSATAGTPTSAPSTGAVSDTKIDRAHPVQQRPVDSHGFDTRSVPVTAEQGRAYASSAVPGNRGLFVPPSSNAVASRSDAPKLTTDSHTTQSQVTALSQPQMHHSAASSASTKPQTLHPTLPTFSAMPPVHSTTVTSTISQVHHTTPCVSVRPLVHHNTIPNVSTQPQVIQTTASTTQPQVHYSTVSTMSVQAAPTAGPTLSLPGEAGSGKPFSFVQSVPGYVYPSHLFSLPGQMIPSAAAFGVPPSRFPSQVPSPAMMPYRPQLPQQQQEAYQRALASPYLPQHSSQPPISTTQPAVTSQSRVVGSQPPQAMAPQAMQMPDSQHSASQAANASLATTTVSNVPQLSVPPSAAQKPLYPHHPLYFPPTGMPHYQGLPPGLPYMSQYMNIRPTPVPSVPVVRPAAEEMNRQVPKPTQPPQSRAMAERSVAQTYSARRDSAPHATPSKPPHPITQHTGHPVYNASQAPPESRQSNQPVSQQPLYTRTEPPQNQFPQRTEHGERVVRAESEQSQAAMVDQHFMRSGVHGNLPSAPPHVPPSALPEAASNKGYSSLPKTESPQAQPHPSLPPHTGVYSQMLPRYIVDTPPHGLGPSPAERFPTAQSVSPHLWPHPGGGFRPPSVPHTPQVQHQTRAQAPQSQESYQKQVQSTQNTSSESHDQVLGLFERYPVIWQGLLALKNDSAAVQTHFICGDLALARSCLPQPDSQSETDKERNLAVLRIVQRMRLEPQQLEGIDNRIMENSDYCLLLALPCGRDKTDVNRQQCALKRGFIDYLKQKQAAGIVNVQHRQMQSQLQYVLHVFPPCDFTTKHLQLHARDLLSNINDIQHIMIVIAAV